MYAWGHAARLISDSFESANHHQVSIRAILHSSAAVRKHFEQLGVVVV